MIDTLKPVVEAATGPAWLKQLRRLAAARAGELGLPTISQEEWKFTSVAPLADLPLHTANHPARSLTKEEIAPFTFGLDCYRLVLVDGFFCPELSILPAGRNGIHIGSLRAELESERELEKHLAQHADYDANFFTALNTACFQDGAFVTAAAGQTIERPVHLLHIATTAEAGAMAHPRHLIIAPERSALTVIETYASLADTAHITNAVTELIIGREARVEHCRIQSESQKAFHFGAVQAEQGKDSFWTSHSIVTGGRIARQQIQSLLNAEGGECVMNGLYLGRDEQTIDHHTVVDHAKPNCASHEYYHGILADRSHGIFNGKIFVQQDAQKTNAKQTNRNLLLSDQAVIDTKPQLEIFADDVKCTHGATVGQLDEEAIFYLRSRGIGAENARRMLIRAFASEVVERIKLEPVRAQLDRMLTERFA